MEAPHAFVLSRQKLKVLKPKRDFGDVSKGAYLLKRRKGATLTIMASGSEVILALQSACHLEVLGVRANIVSVPCLDLFEEQTREYKEQVIDKDTKVLAVEASRAIEYYKYADDVIGIDSFGASAPAKRLFNKFGFTIENVMRRACDLVGVEYREVNLDVTIY